VAAHSIRVGGYELDDAIVRYVQDREKLLIGQEQAETLKLEIGSALPTSLVPAAGEVAGRDLVTGLLRRTVVEADQVRAAIARPLAHIVDAVRDVLERTPAELSSDIADRGLTLVGGGALLPELDTLLRQETGLSVIVADESLTAVARGAGTALEELEALERAGRHRR
jgi:rod shape-determining protein MreB